MAKRRTSDSVGEKAATSQRGDDTVNQPSTRAARVAASEPKGLPIRPQKDQKPPKASSKFRGVTKHRVTGRFEAQFWDASAINAVSTSKGARARGRQVYLGGYNSERKAAEAYDRAAIKFLGVSAKLNFAYEDYDGDQELRERMSREEWVAHLCSQSDAFAHGHSRYRGVTKHHHGKWEARISNMATVGSRYRYLGTFESEEAAARAYDLASIICRKQAAIVNFPITDYLDMSTGELKRDLPWQLPPAVAAHLQNDLKNAAVKPAKGKGASQTGPPNKPAAAPTSASAPSSAPAKKPLAARTTAVSAASVPAKTAAQSASAAAAPMRDPAPKTADIATLISRPAPPADANAGVPPPPTTTHLPAQPAAPPGPRLRIKNASIQHEACEARKPCHVCGCRLPVSAFPTLDPRDAIAACDLCSLQAASCSVSPSELRELARRGEIVLDAAPVPRQPRRRAPVHSDSTVERASKRPRVVASDVLPDAVAAAVTTSGVPPTTAAQPCAALPAAQPFPVITTLAAIPAQPPAPQPEHPAAVVTPSSPLMPADEAVPCVAPGPHGTSELAEVWAPSVADGTLAGGVAPAGGAVLPEGGVAWGVPCIHAVELHLAKQQSGSRGHSDARVSDSNADATDAFGAASSHPSPPAPRKPLHNNARSGSGAAARPKNKRPRRTLLESLRSERFDDRDEDNAERAAPEDAAGGDEAQRAASPRADLPSGDTTPTSGFGSSSFDAAAINRAATTTPGGGAHAATQDRASGGNTSDGLGSDLAASCPTSHCSEARQGTRVEKRGAAGADLPRSERLVKKHKPAAAAGAAGLPSRTPKRLAQMLAAASSEDEVVKIMELHASNPSLFA